MGIMRMLLFLLFSFKTHTYEQGTNLPVKMHPKDDEINQPCAGQKSLRLGGDVL